MKYSIEKLEQTPQDKTMNTNRYKITFENNSSFVCKKLQSRPNHIYFNENTQNEIDCELLDKIEEDILSL